MGKETYAIFTNKGVRQGCEISPTPFNIDDPLRECKMTFKGIIRSRDANLNILLFQTM